MIYQLLEKVTVLSREHIRVTLRDGLEIEQAVEQPKRRKFAFLKTDESTIKHLISQICVIDGASDIIDVEKNFRKQIRYSCIPKYENQICERLEGWWYKKAIEALCSDTPIFVTQSQVRSFIVSVSQEYAECPYQPGNLTAFAAVKFTVKGADNDMAVFRVEKNKGYTVMSNHHLRDKALSLKAKGLLSQKSLFRVVENGEFFNRLRNGHLEKSAATGLFRPSRSLMTAKVPLKVHLRLRFQNLGKPRTAGLCGRAAGACDCGPLSVLLSNGLHHSENLPVKFGFSPQIVPANIVKKLPSQCWPKPLFIAFFNFSHKWPTFAFTGESGYTLGFAQRIAHNGLHAETGAFPPPATAQS